MSFLGKGIKPGVAPVIGKPAAPKPVIGGIKPVVGIKPGIKPAIKPVTKEKENEEVTPVPVEAEENKISIAPKAASAPSIKLPTVKAPSIKPVEEAEGIKEEVIEEKEEVTQEAVETAEETKEESIQETMEAVEEKHPREIAIEQAKKEELVYGEYTIEEWNAMSPQKRGSITRAKTKEAKAKREAGKTAGKESTTKTQTKEPVEFVPTLLPQRSSVDYEELIANLVITSLGEEWDKMVDQVRVQLKSIQITPDMNSATMKQATADLAALRDEIYYEATQAKTTFEGVTSKIEVVKGLNTKGASAEERKLNGLRACVHYSEGGYDINLFELLEVARVKYNFYSETMKQIEYKKNALITMNGALKLEKDLGVSN